MEKHTILSKNREKSDSFGLPSYSFSEELLNSLTHGFGVLFSICVFLILLLKHSENLLNLTSVFIYAVTLFVLYMGSTLYHCVKKPKIKSYLRKFDHCSIFLLIAGTYTPICTIYIKAAESKIVLSAVWILAFLGIILNLIDVNKFSKFSLACYILMGWSIIFMAKPAVSFLSPFQLKMLLFGGICYTVGAIIYVIGKKVKYMHSVWHLFVLAGSVFHFMVLI